PGLAVSRCGSRFGPTRLRVVAGGGSGVSHTKSRRVVAGTARPLGQARRSSIGSCDMTACRTCKGPRLYMFLPLGRHPLANGFFRAEQLNQPEPRFPLDVHACLDCGLIQVRDNVPAEFFRHYVYLPSAADAMHKHFADFAGVVAARFLRSPGALTVDI